MATPNWQAPTNLSGANSNLAAGVNQLLGTHANAEIFDGVLFGQVTSGYGGPLSTLGQPGWQALTAGVQIDQPFVLSGSSGIGRIEVPLAILAGPGADVTVQLFADSGGLPSGGALQTVTFPRQFLAAVCLIGLVGAGVACTAKVNGGAVSSWSTDIAAQLPAPTTNNIGFGTASANGYVIVAGGQNFSGTVIPNVYTASLGGDLGAWQAASPLPVATSTVQLAGSPSGVLVSVGGSNASGFTNAVYTATINGSGTVSAWTQQPNYPTNIYAGVAVAVTLPSGDYVYQLGGATDNTVGDETNAVYWASATGGNIPAWNPGPPLPNPTPLRGIRAAVVGNQMFVMGGLDDVHHVESTATWIANINADGSLNGWRTGPPLPFGNDSMAVAVVGNTIVLIGGEGSGTEDDVWTLTVGNNGDIGTWRVQPNINDGQFFFLASAVANQISSSDWRLTIIGSQHIAATFSTVPHVSVPISTSGLTSGATYHLVLSSTASNASPLDVNHTSQVHVGSGSTGPVAHYKPPGGAWTAYPAGSAVPVAAYAGNGGRLAHRWEDGGAKWSWWLWNNLTGSCVGYGDVCGQIRSMAGLTYDPNGLITATIPVA